MSSQQSPEEDLLPKIKGAYRLLALFTEQGSNGLVDKVVIPQDSLRNLIDVLRPGAFESMTNINFAALDEVLLKPVGIYGSKSRIVEFLEEVNAIDTPTAKELLMPLPLNGVPPGPYLRTGIYLILDGLTQQREHSMDLDAGLVQPAFLLYWPEENTWDDDAVGDITRNRTTFMHYLGQLSNQLIALLSKEHADSIVWDGDAANIAEGEVPDSDESDDDLVFQFVVQKTVEQEESVKVHEGFEIPISSELLSTVDPDPQHAGELDVLLKPRVVLGDTRQALLVTEFIPQRRNPKKITAHISGMALQKKLTDNGNSIRLADDLRVEALEILIENGLENHFKSLCEDYKETKRREELMVQQEFQSLCAGAKEALASDTQRLEHHISNQLVQHLVNMYPPFEVELVSQIQDVTYRGPDDVVVHHLSPLKDGVFDLLTFNSIIEPGFQDLKRRFMASVEALKFRKTEVSPNELQRLDTAILTGTNWDSVKSTILEEPTPSGGSALLPTRLVASITSTFGRRTGFLKARRPQRHETAPMSDPEFIRRIHNEDYGGTLDLSVTKLCNKALNWLLRSMDSESRKLAQSESAAFFQQWKCGIDTEYRLKSQEKRCKLLLQLRDRINDESKAKGTGSLQLWVHDIALNGGHHKCSSFKFTSMQLKHEPAHFEHTLHLLGLMTEDTQELTVDSSVVPRPVFHPRAHSICFRVPATSRLRHVQLLEGSKCIVVVEDRDSSTGRISIYLDDEARIPAMLDARTCKRVFNSERIGEDFLFSVNEPRKLVALMDAKCHLCVYAIDASYSGLHLRGSPIDLRRLMMGSGAEAKFLKMCFISGHDEMLLIEDSGYARIYSFEQEQFKPAFLKLDSPPTDVCSSPDGSCIFISVPTDSGTVQTVAYHTASFGGNGSQGISLQLPHAFVSTSTTITSFVTRKNAYLMAIKEETRQLSGIRLEIANKAGEFTFRACGKVKTDRKRESRHNSLIDCHAGVWTKFPVVSVISRSPSFKIRHPPSISFTAGSSSIPIHLLRSYFSQMIRSFEDGTRKPTDSKLIAIDVRHTPSPSLRKSIPSAITTYFTGKWIVDLICLIPIHIAVATSNRFTPLKDGISSPAFEQQLLGADISAIADSISIGWYESIFRTYMASKPVKVVSSMGEQSVGKSYALNHFVDTSFAGSAMRCTEGVWLSATPTDTNLIVSLDFEAIHSIERTSQEDMLLVLFNVALSNLVLFRNNFVLSRDVTELFMSFQASAAQFEPSENPGLFQSTLAIIIKDVVASDTEEIVREFQLKFQKIVHEEKERNFISRLHCGELVILPWPVIQSPKFYTSMKNLKKLLDAQDSSHGTASVFLERMKVLMAKLRASDWGALDNALASHRAQLLQSLLPNALAYGITEVRNMDSYLKNLDTDEEIQSEATIQNHFYLDFLMKDSEVRDELLVKLRRQGTAAITAMRQRVPDSEWFNSLAKVLHWQAEERIEYVRRWISSNTTRFSEQIDIQLLYRHFSQLSLELFAGVDLCGVNCNNCNLKCILSKHHLSEHDCTTDHRCALMCDECGSGTQEKLCGMRAGHDGSHICDVTQHVCSEPCYLQDRRGCQHACTKPVGHQDAVHLCSTRIHFCGEPCRLGLIEQDGSPLCSKPCAIDCRDEHDSHQCENRITCPAKCRLCSRLCSVESHIHPLQNGAIHLCGQEHDCKEYCGSRGICKIDSAPRSIETTFVGRNETFQYTKYTQIANKLPCAVRIPKNRLGHDGVHSHTANGVEFHFCEARCPFCSYFCNLAIDHRGSHSTTHGNMEQTCWSFEGDDSAVREIASRKFSTGDSGAPMYCNMSCKELGRHAHIDFCRAQEGERCVDDTVEHIISRMNPEPKRDKDWITHALCWARTGFRDPYPQDLQDDFSKCDSECIGDEHKATGNTRPQRSYCILPMFHEPNTRSTTGYTSRDGHSFNCKNPGLYQATYHVIFVLDSSSSMSNGDRLPLAGQAATSRITRRNNNRYGAVLSAVYSFWTARAGAVPGVVRHDAYSVIVFSSTATTIVDNDIARGADALLEPLLAVSPGRGTDFAAAMREAQRVMELNWSADRAPVVVFLSDGEAPAPSEEVRSICNMAVSLGQPLSFHTVFFGARSHSAVLDYMAAIAAKIYGNASPRTLSDIPCGSHYAIDSIQLAQTFLNIADSMRQVRVSAGASF